MDTLDLLLHPVRLRIVHAMAGGRTRTISDLCASLLEVTKTSVYQHIGLLTDAGLLEVVDEQRVHGAVERHYRLHRERAVIDQETAASMSLDDHRHGFAAAAAVLLADFNTYLDRDHADPVADSVGYTQHPLRLTPGELSELISEIRGSIESKRHSTPAPDRRLHLFSPILFPIEEPSQRKTDQRSEPAKVSTPSPRKDRIIPVK